jgi:anthranilate phosphoribosyltransferase
MDYLEFRAMNGAIVLAAEGEASNLAHGFDAAGQLWGSVQSREMLNVQFEYA